MDFHKTLYERLKSLTPSLPTSPCPIDFSFSFRVLPGLLSAGRVPKTLGAICAFSKAGHCLKRTACFRVGNWSALEHTVLTNESAAGNKQAICTASFRGMRRRRDRTRDVLLAL